MADIIYITCPECDVKFKATSDKEGKKVRCPECDEPFRVEEDMISRPKLPKKPAKPKNNVPSTAITKNPNATKPPPEKPEEPKDPDDEFDADGNPYGVQEVEVKPRCPNCAKEMADEKAFICLYCGYNSLTRTIGKTEKTVALSFEEHMAHLAGPLAGIGTAVVIVIFLLWFCICYPDIAGNGWMSIFASEAARMWVTIISLFFIYGFGSTGLNKVIFTPKPKEKEKE